MVETADLAELIEIDEITRTECLHLLAGGVIGRIVFSDAAMPAAQPVTYVIDGGEILFRAATASALAVPTHRTVVAFEADEIDHRELTGWTVLGIGEAYPVTETSRLAGLTGASIGPATGSAVTIAVKLQRLTGHLLGPALARAPRPAGPPTVATAPGDGRR